VAKAHEFRAFLSNFKPTHYMEQEAINFKLHPTILNQNLRGVYCPESFVIPEGVRYFDGNSLGPATLEGLDCLTRVTEEWKTLLVGGWTGAKIPWFFYAETLAGMLAPIIGAKPEEVGIQNSTTINLHLLLATFFKPKPDSKRNVILTEEGAFPSDEYALQGFLKLKGLNPKKHLRLVKRQNLILSEEDIVNSMEADVSLIILSSVLYQTGQLLDVAYLTEKAHEKGIMIGFDCSHSAGIVDHDFSRDNIDFAVFPTYKWLNSGGGSVAGLYVNQRHEAKMPGLPGWFGSDKKVQFDMSPVFQPANGAGRFQVGTPHIFSMAPIEGSLRMYERIGIENIRQASLALTDYMIHLLDTTCSHLSIKVVTPREHNSRGGAISIFHSEAAAINEALKHRKITGDYREPDLIRLAPNPLYVSFVDVFEVVETLREIIETGEYLQYSNERQLVA